MMTNSITLLVSTLNKDRHLRARIIRLTLAEFQSLEMRRFFVAESQN
jgi:hypothetical protein